MRYQQFDPLPHLAAYIKFFWTLEHAPSDETINWERVLPDGCVELVFHYGHVFQRKDKNNRAHIQERASIIGQIDKYIEIAPTGKTGILAVRFYPQGVQAFLNFPALELTGTSAGLDIIFGKAANALEDQLLHAKDQQERIFLLQHFLSKQLQKNQHQQKDELVAACLTQVMHTNGNVSVRQLATEMKISERQLERRFSSTIGLSPKLFSRIIRFQNIFKLMEAKQHIKSLTSLSHEAGYYDQAHFIRDFKGFSGINPSHYFKESHALSSHFVGK